MEKLSIIVVSVLFSSIIAMLGYFLKTTYQENKDMFKELAKLKHCLLPLKYKWKKAL